MSLKSVAVSCDVDRESRLVRVEVFVAPGGKYERREVAYVKAEEPQIVAAIKEAFGWAVERALKD